MNERLTISTRYTFVIHITIVRLFYIMDGQEKTTDKKIVRVSGNDWKYHTAVCYIICTLQGEREWEDDHIKQETYSRRDGASRDDTELEKKAEVKCCE